MLDIKTHQFLCFVNKYVLFILNNYAAVEILLLTKFLLTFVVAYRYTCVTVTAVLISLLSYGRV